MTDLLVVDIGNTTTRVGLWKDGSVGDVTVIPTGGGVDIAGILRTLSDQERLSVALSSVVPAAQRTWIEWCERTRRPLFLLRGDTPTPLTSHYSDAEHLGSDRLAAAVGAVRRLGAPVIAVSLGTATVVDAVSAANEFLGGAIAVGIETGLAALNERTAALPRVSAAAPPGVIGSDAESCLRSGAVVGTAALVEGLSARMRETVGSSAPLVLTGGHADLISKHIRLDHQVIPNLALEGLAIIWEHNHGRA